MAAKRHNRTKANTKTQTRNEKLNLFGPESVGLHSQHELRLLICLHPRNLQHWYARGVIGPPSALGSHYRVDSTVDAGGWLPVFISKVPLSLLQLLGDAPCIAEISLDRVQGGCFPFSDTLHAWRSDLSSLDQQTRGFFVPLPVPWTCVTAILFRDARDSKRFLGQLAGIDGVSRAVLEQLVRVEPVVFDVSADPSPFTLSPPEAVPLHSTGRVDSHAGFLAGLWLISYASDSASRLFLDTLAANEYPDELNLFGLFADLVSKDYDPEVLKALSGFAERLIAGLAMPPSDSRESLEDRILALLDDHSIPGYSALRLTELQSELQRLGSLSEHSTEESFQSFPFPVHRALMMLFLAGGTFEPAYFESLNPLNNDHLLMLLFFTTAKGWQRIPSSFRARIPPVVQESLFCHMASLSQTTLSPERRSRFSAERPAKPFRLYFSADSDWTQAQNNAAAEILQRLNRLDVITTTMTLPRKSELHIELQKGQLSFRGRCVLKEDIDIETFRREALIAFFWSKHWSLTREDALVQKASGTG